METQQMNTNPKTGSGEAGSYDFGSYQGQKAELDRLDAQAASTWPLELNFFRRAGLRTGMDVLDLGCGPGFLSARLAPIVGTEGSVVGIDYSVELLEVARARNQAPQVSYRQGSAYAIDLPDASIDFVCARLLFQHLERPLEAAREILRVLRPGGSAVLIDCDDGVLSFLPEAPTYSGLTERAAALQKGRGGDREVGRKLGHYLRAAGAGAVGVDLEVFTSDQVGMKAIIDVAVAFKTELFPEEERAGVRQQIAALTEAMAQPGAFALVGLYLVSGKRPAG